jgi:hypothetical protein
MKEIYLVVTIMVAIFRVTTLIRKKIRRSIKFDFWIFKEYTNGPSYMGQAFPCDITNHNVT